MDIKALVDKYESQRDSYIKPSYNEAQLRADFVDPLFEILGWDIKNNQSKPTNEREVLVEESLKQSVNAKTKKPDYTFRLFSERKFFTEAKKPSVNVANDDEAAKQVRRYGFTAKLKISVLTNFEYLIIYDCSKPVKETDNANSNRIRVYHYSEYVEHFEEIINYLGRGSVYTGRFDEVWKNIEEQISLSSVDNLFLKQINEWRLILGKEIYSHNNELDEDKLNDLVQSYLNSLIFLRVCEDRHLEKYETLLNFANKEDHNALIQQFAQSDKKYNAGLFNHPLINKIISSNKSAFWMIIKQLYYPESTYSFVVFASDILGNIYEIFLAQRLRIISQEVVLEKKPEYIDRDIVTTPNFIVRDILRQTVTEYCKDKTDKEILSISVADIACGSGAFLLETYQLLHDLLVDFYLSNNKKILIQTSANSFKLPYSIKRGIIENCIYGIDKDFNAVEACKFGLLLKLLEDEHNDTITAPALPNIDSKIQFGNSLIDSDMLTKSSNEINPYDFMDTKYDLIVGNPPYMATEDMKQITPLELPIYKKRYISSYKQFDKYFLFIERGIKLLKEGGMLGYIIPSKLFKVGAGTKIRNMFATDKDIKRVISFGANQVFKDKTTYTCILVVEKANNESFEYLEVNDLKLWQTRNVLDDDYADILLDSLEDDSWVLVPEQLKSVYKSICSQSLPLESLVKTENIYNGIQTSANKIYVHKALKEDGKYFYFNKDKKDWKIEKKLTKPYYETSRGDDNLNTYRPLRPNRFVIYPYIRSKKGIELVDINILKKKYPFAHSYLEAHKETLEKRDIKPVPDTNDEWYRYGRHQSLDKCDVEAKIVVGVMSQGDKYTIDRNKTLISSGGTAGYCMITLPDNFPYSIYYIQAVLNSKYVEWIASLRGEVFRGGYIARGTKVLKKLPIRIIDFSKKDDLELHNKIADTQKLLISCQQKIDLTKERRTLVPLEREFKRLKRQLDAHLKTLYTLDTDDSKIPEIAELYATN